MPEFNQQQQQVNTQLNAGRDINADHIGNKITTGDVKGSNLAIGEGATAIGTLVISMLSAVDELEKSIRVAEKYLAESILRILNRYTSLNIPDAKAARANPYKSLLDYKLEDVPYFYGRDDAIAAMQERMRQGRLTILESDSGSGKTSLLQAGLASHMLAGGNFPLYVRPYNLPPNVAIRRAFLPDYATQSELGRYADDAMTLRGFLERVTYYMGNREITIFLDQFEEFFTELPVTERAKFAAQLRDCIESDLPVRWVLALRKEYLAELRVFEPLKPFNNKYFLPTFKLEEAKVVLTEPAALKGIKYETGLVDRILADIRGDSEVIPPVQVQLVCYTLFEELTQEEGESTISCAQYDRRRGRGEGRPGAAGILSSHLTRVLDNELTGPERKVAGRVLEALVTSDARRVVRSKANLVAVVAAEETGEIDSVLEVLYENRIVRHLRDDSDESVFELSHDYLIEGIGLDESTQWRKLARETLDNSMLVWRRKAANYESLISEDKLLVIEEYLASSDINDDEHELIERSRQKVAAEKAAKEAQIELLKRRQRITRASLGLVSFVALGLFANFVLYPYIMKQQASRDDFAELIPVGGGELMMEAYEVTNDRYAKCVDYGPCDSPDKFWIIRDNWETDQYKPVVGVDVFDAMTFCDWIGRELPTADQWMAASVPGDQWKEFTESEALLCREGGCLLTPVGLRDVPQYPVAGTNAGGIYDLVGSVGEWTRTTVVNEPHEIPLCRTHDNTDSILGSNENVSFLGDFFVTEPKDAGNAAYASNSTRWVGYSDEFIGFRCVVTQIEPLELQQCPEVKP